MKSLFNTLNKLKLPAVLAAALSLGACASNRVDGFMDESSRGVPLVGGVAQRTFNPDHAKSATLAAGLQNENAPTRAAAERIICTQTNEATEPVKRRSRWAEVSGRTPQVRCKP